MKTKLWGLLLFFVLCVGLYSLIPARTQQGAFMQENEAKNDERLFDIEELNEIREKKKTSYHSFLNNATMHCGVYHLKAGAKDGQSPHREDEVYYVQSGKGKLKIEGKSYECKPGAILFVAAGEKHFFHDIEEDLTLLVFFSKAKPAKDKE